MASKRLLDFVILASTTKSILTQNVRLRANNANLYAQTSSVLKPLMERWRSGIIVDRSLKPEVDSQQQTQIQSQIKREKQKGEEHYVSTSASVESIGRKGEYVVEPNPTSVSSPSQIPSATFNSMTTHTVFPTNPDTEPKPPPPPPPAVYSPTTDAKLGSTTEAQATASLEPDIFLLRSARHSSPLVSKLKLKKAKHNVSGKNISEGGMKENLGGSVQIAPVATPFTNIKGLRKNWQDAEAMPAQKVEDVGKEDKEKEGENEVDRNSIRSERGEGVKGDRRDVEAILAEGVRGTAEVASLSREEQTGKAAGTSKVTPIVEVPASEKEDILRPPSPPSNIPKFDINLSDQAPNEQTFLNSPIHRSGSIPSPGEDNALPSPSNFAMSASAVPSSRLSRMFHYTSLAAGMAFGALGEGLKRTVDGSGSPGEGRSNKPSPMLSEANVNRLVRKLSLMRGAALKLGQMLSFQDSNLLPPTLQQVFSRVQDSADYMPPSQRDRVLTSTLGPQWRDLFISFSEQPMAAASVGQVHSATLSPELIPPELNHPKDVPYEVAVKIQYPGVAQSISSDLSNLSLLLKASRILPKGLYLDKMIENARTELAWECDYVRELENIQRFHTLLPPSPNNPFMLPIPIPQTSGDKVLTMSRLGGVPATRITDLTQQEKDHIGEEILRLSLREIAQFRFMQTDPNWSNFLWNRETGKIELLDFGACRAYPEEFVQTYVALLRAARRRDKAACEKLSIQLGYLTGLESSQMTNAHVQSMLILAEPFIGGAEEDERYDFGSQTITERVKSLIPLMVRERLTPPPEETYSLHRKLSGAFLLCARLGSKVRCARVFEQEMEM